MPNIANTSPRASCLVVAKNVEWLATPAEALDLGQRNVESAKKDHPDDLQRTRDDPVDGAC